MFYEKRIQYVTGIGGKHTTDTIPVSRIFSSVFTQSRKKIKFLVRHIQVITSSLCNQSIKMDKPSSEWWNGRKNNSASLMVVTV